jgi:diguanylate cyclase (GGDEF)-like protein
VYHGGRDNGDAEASFLDASGLEKVLDAELSRAARHELPISLVMLEVSAGRASLSDSEVSGVARVVAATIEERIRKEDHAARLGPLRFAVIAVETGNSDTIATDLAAHVRHAVSRSSSDVPLTVSVGAVDCQFDELPRQELLREAERSLAAAILSGAGVAFPATSEGPQLGAPSIRGNEKLP